MTPIFVSAQTGAATASAATSAITSTWMPFFMSIFLSDPVYMTIPLKERADRKLEHPRLFPRAPIKVQAVGQPQGAERRDPPAFDAGRRAQVQVPRISIVERLSIVEKQNSLDFELGGHRKNVVEIEDELLGPSEWALIRSHRAGLTKLESPHGLDAADKVPVADRKPASGGITVGEPRPGSRVA